MTKLKILIVEDSEDDLQLLLSALRKGGFELTYTKVQEEQEMREALEREAWQIIISDYSLPQFDAKRALEVARPFDVPFFVLSGTISETIAAEVMRAGAQDYVMKGNLTRLIPAIYRELDLTAHRQQLQRVIQQKEDQLRHSQKMEALGRFAGGIAHDFNNFLGAVTIMTDLVSNKLERGHPGLNHLNNIKETVKKATALTRQILTFSRSQPMELEELDLNSGVTNIQQMLRSVVGGQVECKFDLAKDLRPIRLNTSQLEQVILNLVVNARDAMSAKGQIRIATFFRELPQSLITGHSEVPSGKYSVLAVTDTGAGMDEFTLQHLFEPFFTTKGNQGTGLGLATVFGIVQKAGGSISVESHPGKGTTFEIYFPCHEGVPCKIN